MPKATSARDKIPAGQIVRESRRNEKGELFAYITSDALYSSFTYWAVDGDKLTKKATESSPARFPWIVRD